MEVFTIGFTKSSAADFFGRLKMAGVTRLVDVRLNNSSQLAAFAKQKDLRYFLRELCGAEYVHEQLLAPTQDILDRYKKRKGAWAEYEREFFDLIAERQIETKLDPAVFNGRTVLLCSEPEATHCHRRLVLEYLQKFWDGLRISHL
jgi:uncharacterized protein (DUF488 family)